MMSNLDELNSIPHEIVQDKALPNQDHLYKLIIIGDTGKFANIFCVIALQASEKAVCWQE